MSFLTKSTVLAAVISALAACGGDPPQPKTPDPEPVATGAASADMPPPAPTTASTEKPATPEAPVSGVADPNAAPVTLSLPPATAKIAMKGKKTANVELKTDGTVTNGGKAVAKVSGTKLETPDGKTVLAVEKDAVNTGDGAAYGTFAGDELTITKAGDKLSLGDDGTLTWTAGGKASPLGKFEGAGNAKRAAVLAAAFVVAPPAADKAPAAKPGDKPAAKPGDKPAEKPAAKPAAPAKK
ncbi:MAG: hypothetical protein JST00_44720 [Deltaproteobacteria bacterium]|nr:hypothetical protein [Deltaproteobacteria bacterium]